MNFPLSRFDDVVDTIAASKAVYFTVLDLASGFWQIPVSESRKEKTCFVTESGTYCYKRMPFGVVNAPSVFSMVMSEILRGINWIHALVYVDDIMVFSRSLEEHQQHLQDVFDRLKEAGLKLKPSKCHFTDKKVTYLGHNFSKEGVSVDTSKTKCVASFPIPKNRTDVRSFLGLATYYKRFVKGFSHIAAPLYKLLGESTKFEFTEECKTAFEKLKQALVTAPILRYPDFDKEFFLYGDSSDYSIGYILGQKDDEGKEVVIHYGGCVLRPAEINYPITHNEGLALVEGIKYYHIYLTGRKFTVLTDHQTLKSLQTNKDVSGRLARWVIHLQGYDFDTVYEPGKKHGNVDALSRRTYPLTPEPKGDGHEILVNLQLQLNAQFLNITPDYSDNCATLASLTNTSLVNPTYYHVKTPPSPFLEYELSFNCDEWEDKKLNAVTVTDYVRTILQDEDEHKECDPITLLNNVAANTKTSLREEQLQEEETGPMIRYKENQDLPVDDNVARRLILKSHDYEARMVFYSTFTISGAKDTRQKGL